MYMYIAITKDSVELISNEFITQSSTTILIDFTSIGHL